MLEGSCDSRVVLLAEIVAGNLLLTYLRTTSCPRSSSQDP